MKKEELDKHLSEISKLTDEIQADQSLIAWAEKECAKRTKEARDRISLNCTKVATLSVVLRQAVSEN